MGAPECVVFTKGRVAAYRDILQVQNMLFWKEITSSILKGTAGLGLDTALFLMDLKFLKLCGLPTFIKHFSRHGTCLNRRDKLSALAIRRASH